ncbi:MAG: hypothetical protein GY738_26250 [Pseudoalteromonas sp.]|nr:hypothetical protein [Pseudoalteromonas sp.]
MNAQQLHDFIISPTLVYMGKSYNSKNARFLLLCTAAIESKCGHYIKQINGPALGIWQMEPATEDDVWGNCDALDNVDFNYNISSLQIDRARYGLALNGKDLVLSPTYACAMARLKYSMDSEPLPDYNDFKAVYEYYKRIYNTPLGASTYAKFKQACIDCGIFEVKL